MLEVGDLNQFGFRISPASPEPQVRDVSIFICGNDLTHGDNAAYLPSFIAELNATSNTLKRKIDYLRHEAMFRGLNVTQIHNLLLHGDPEVFADDREWGAISEAHRFAEWGETTDGFAAFLVPYCDRLYLTCQSRTSTSLNYDVLEVIDGVETTPYYLFATIDEAVSILNNET